MVFDKYWLKSNIHLVCWSSVNHSPSVLLLDNGISQRKQQHGRFGNALAIVTQLCQLLRIFDLNPFI